MLSRLHYPATMPDRQKVKLALTTLAEVGNTEAIAEYLLTQGYLGIVGSPYRCPVARYLQAQLGTEAICVDGYHATITAFDKHATAYAEKDYKLPEPLKAFTQLFDNGAFPKLNRRRQRKKG